jgi:hypothetical protein
VKYKEYNKIIDDYKKMAKAAKASGNEYAVKICNTIVEDLELLLKNGALELFPHKKE